MRQVLVCFQAFLLAGLGAGVLGTQQEQARGSPAGEGTIFQDEGGRLPESPELQSERLTLIASALRCDHSPAAMEPIMWRASDRVPRGMSLLSATQPRTIFTVPEGKTLLLTRCDPIPSPDGLPALPVALAEIPIPSQELSFATQVPSFMLLPTSEDDWAVLGVFRGGASIELRVCVPDDFDPQKSSPKLWTYFVPEDWSWSGFLVEFEEPLLGADSAAKLIAQCPEGLAAFREAVIEALQAQKAALEADMGAGTDEDGR